MHVILGNIATFVLNTDVVLVDQIFTDNVPCNTLYCGLRIFVMVPSLRDLIRLFGVDVIMHPAGLCGKRTA